MRRPAVTASGVGMGVRSTRKASVRNEGLRAVPVMMRPLSETAFASMRFQPVRSRPCVVSRSVLRFCMPLVWSQMNAARGKPEVLDPWPTITEPSAETSLALD